MRNDEGLEKVEPWFQYSLFDDETGEKIWCGAITQITYGYSEIKLHIPVTLPTLEDTNG